MKTIFAVFLLLPVTTGLKSYACSGSNDESVQHNLYCEAGERIKIISGQYGFKYSSDSCNRDCKYQSPQCDCRRDFVPAVETNLTNLCNWKKTCNFQPPKPDYEYCHYYNRRKLYAYSYIQYECVTGFLLYSCTEKSDEHRLYCEEGERLNIISGQYSFSNESCSNRCQYSDSCDCLLDFNSTVESNLKNSCNGLNTCNFQPASPHSDSCSTQYPYDYTYSYIVFGCLAVTTTLSARTTSTTRDQGTYGVTGQIYTDISTIKSTKHDNSKQTSSADKDISGTHEAVLNTTEINKPMTVNHNQDTADTAVIAGSVTGCIILVIAVIIVVVILKRKKSMCYKEDGTTNTVYETPTAFNTDVTPYTDLAMSHHSGDQPNYQNVSRFGQQGHSDVNDANK